MLADNRVEFEENYFFYQFFCENCQKEKDACCGDYYCSNCGGQCKDCPTLEIILIERKTSRSKLDAIKTWSNMYQEKKIDGLLALKQINEICNRK